MQYTKKCNKCLKILPSSHFNKRRASSQTLEAVCKQCRKNRREERRKEIVDRDRKYYLENKEEIRARQSKYRLTHKSEITIQHREYYLENKDRISRRDKEYYSENKDRILSTNKEYRTLNNESINKRKKEYYEENPEVLKRSSNNRRARKAASLGTISKGLIPKLFEQQLGLCPCCGLSLGEDYHVDHIMPLALGGTNTDDNIQLLRKSCNLQKHCLHPDVYMKKRGFKPGENALTKLKETIGGKDLGEEKKVE